MLFRSRASLSPQRPRLPLPRLLHPAPRLVLRPVPLRALRLKPRPHPPRRQPLPAATRTARPRAVLTPSLRSRPSELPLSSSRDIAPPLSSLELDLSMRTRCRASGPAHTLFNQLAALALRLQISHTYCPLHTHTSHRPFYWLGCSLSLTCWRLLIHMYHWLGFGAVLCSMSLSVFVLRNNILSVYNVHVLELGVICRR